MATTTTRPALLPGQHRMVIQGVPGWVQWATCPCPAGWMSPPYRGEDDAFIGLREVMASHTGDGPDQTWCSACGQPMTPNDVEDVWITCPNAGRPEICTDCCGED